VTVCVRVSIQPCVIVLSCYCVAFELNWRWKACSSCEIRATQRAAWKKAVHDVLVLVKLARPVENKANTCEQKRCFGGSSEKAGVVVLGVAVTESHGCKLTYSTEELQEHGISDIVVRSTSTERLEHVARVHVCLRRLPQHCVVGHDDIAYERCRLAASMLAAAGCATVCVGLTCPAETRLHMDCAACRNHLAGF